MRSFLLTDKVLCEKPLKVKGFLLLFAVICYNYKKNCGCHMDLEEAWQKINNFMVVKGAGKWAYGNDGELKAVFEASRFKKLLFRGNVSDEDLVFSRQDLSFLKNVIDDRIEEDYGIARGQIEGDVAKAKQEVNILQETQEIIRKTLEDNHEKLFL
tara:strand:+ start:77 stop:544 length:468 start_codon:yes stop_codon:yes gene_type:complete